MCKVALLLGLNDFLSEMTSSYFFSTLKASLNDFLSTDAVIVTHLLVKLLDMLSHRKISNFESSALSTK